MILDNSISYQNGYVLLNSGDIAAYNGPVSDTGYRIVFSIPKDDALRDDTTILFRRDYDGPDGYEEFHKLLMSFQDKEKGTK